MKKILVIALFIFFLPLSIFSSSLSCAGTSLLNLFIPGSGYLISGQFDKLVYSAGRYIVLNKGLQAQNDPSFDNDADNIFVRSVTGDDIPIIDIYYNKPTWERNTYLRIDANLSLITFWDLYQHDCKPTNEIYKHSIAPFRFTHFYDKWQFWLPLGLLYFLNNHSNSGPIINWHLQKNLTKNQIRNESFALYYTVGIAEEMIFRDIIQKDIFYFYQNFFSSTTSYHAGIVTSSLLFGLAHSGQGFSANSTQAFFFGLYFGYIYQPTPDTFDLTTAIALHSWYDIMVSYYTIQNSNFTKEERANFEFKLLSTSFRF